MGLFDRFSKKNKSEEDKPQENNPQNEPISEDTQQLLMDTLRELGCQPEIDERGNVNFRYQGESFYAISFGKFLRIWDLPFMNINVLDTRMPLMLEAINSVNREFGPVVIMREPDKDGDRSIASRMDFVFIPQLPNLPNYIESILSLFFDIKHKLHEEINKLTNSQSGNDQSSPLTSGGPSQN